MYQNQLTVSHLSVSVGDKKIVTDVSLTIKSSQFHVIMGPNGSGKSSLSHALMGHPEYAITAGTVSINDDDITAVDPEIRAQKGLMLAFQNPLTIAGVGISQFLRTAYKSLYPDSKMSAVEFHKKLVEQAALVHLDPATLKRGLNEGFSGGEKKKLEMLQLLILQPKFAIFDEIDTGLDVDALKAVSGAIGLLQKNGCGILLITHYQRILTYLTPEYVHIMKSGMMVKEGGPELIGEIEKDGYANI